MPDIATIGAALGSIKTATDIAKIIKDSGSSLEQAEIKYKVAELISALADAKIEIADVQGIILDKDRVINELRESIEKKESLQWDKPYYWKVSGDDKDGPYCQKCYDLETHLIRLQGGKNGSWNCKVCENNFYDSSYVKPGPIRISY